jgi:hypothetical protein
VNCGDAPLADVGAGCRGVIAHPVSETATIVIIAATLTIDPRREDRNKPTKQQSASQPVRVANIGNTSTHRDRSQGLRTVWLTRLIVVFQSS